MDRGTYHCTAVRFDIFQAYLRIAEFLLMHDRGKSPHTLANNGPIIKSDLHTDQNPRQKYGDDCRGETILKPSGSHLQNENNVFFQCRYQLAPGWS